MTNVPWNWRTEKTSVAFVNTPELPRAGSLEKGKSAVVTCRIEDTVLAIMDDIAARRNDPYIKTRSDAVRDASKQWCWWKINTPTAFVSPMLAAKLRSEERQRQLLEMEETLEKYRKEITLYRGPAGSVLNPKLNTVLHELTSLRDTFEGPHVAVAEDMIRSCRTLLGIKINDN